MVSFAPNVNVAEAASPKTNAPAAAETSIPKDAPRTKRHVGFAGPTDDDDGGAAHKAQSRPSPSKTAPAPKVRTLSDLVSSSVRTGREAAGLATESNAATPATVASTTTDESGVAAVEASAPSCVREHARQHEKEKLRFQQKKLLREQHQQQQQQQEQQDEKSEHRKNEGDTKAVASRPRRRAVSFSETPPETKTVIVEDATKAAEDNVSFATASDVSDVDASDSGASATATDVPVVDASAPSCVREEARQHEKEKLLFQQKKLLREQQNQQQPQQQQAGRERTSGDLRPRRHRVSFTAEAITESKTREDTKEVETNLSFAVMTPVEYEATLRLAKETGMATEDGRSIVLDPSVNPDGGDDDGADGGTTGGSDEKENTGKVNANHEEPVVSDESDTNSNDGDSEGECEGDREHDDEILAELGLLDLVDHSDACPLDMEDIEEEAYRAEQRPGPSSSTDEGGEKKQPRAFLVLWEALSDWVSPRTQSLVMRWNNNDDGDDEGGGSGRNEKDKNDGSGEFDATKSTRRAGVASMVRMHADRSLSELRIAARVPQQREEQKEESPFPEPKNVQRRLAELVRTFDCSRSAPKWSAKMWRGMTTVLIGIAFPETSVAAVAACSDGEEKVSHGKGFGWGAVEKEGKDGAGAEPNPPSVRALGLTVEEYRYLVRSAVSSLGGGAASGVPSSP